MGINGLAHKFTIDREGNYVLFERISMKLPVPVCLGNLYEYEADHGKIFLPFPGLLYLARGYKWNGASGVTIDTPDTYRASCVHDALYALIKEHKAGREARLAADKNFLRMLKEDGMPWIRRYTWYLFVRLFGWRYC